MVKSRSPPFFLRPADPGGSLFDRTNAAFAAASRKPWSRMTVSHHFDTTGLIRLVSCREAERSARCRAHETRPGGLQIDDLRLHQRSEKNGYCYGQYGHNRRGYQHSAAFHALEDKSRDLRKRKRAWLPMTRGKVIDPGVRTRMTGALQWEFCNLLGAEPSWPLRLASPLCRKRVPPCGGLR